MILQLFAAASKMLDIHCMSASASKAAFSPAALMGVARVPQESSLLFTIVGLMQAAWCSQRLAVDGLYASG